MQKCYKYYDLIAVLFVVVLLISNIVSAAKIVDWGLDIAGLPLVFDAGTLLFPLSYIFGDILTEVYGYKHSRRVIWFGFFSAGLMAFTFWLVGLMPGEAAWQEYAGQTAYDAILGGVATGGIVIASLAAYWAGEFSNSVVLAKLKVATAGRFLWLRTIGSTLIGQGIDTVIFVVVASAFGVFPWAIALSLITANYIFKVTIEVLFTPLTYLIVGYLKKVENEDHYDRDTNFNPFSLAS
jgi:uncharacterized integral membrane protein (TIGR00697 family)